MNMIAPDMPIVRLPTGCCHVADGPCVISTVLGSCVAVTMFDPARRMGAACHAFLPDRSRGSDSRTHRAQPCRFVAEAVPRMLEDLVGLGAKFDRLVVKLFGGADGLTRGDGRMLTVGMGRKNSAMAILALKDLGLTPAVMSVGGMQGRKLLFNTHTGEAWVKRLASDRQPARRIGRRTKASEPKVLERKDKT